MSGEKKMMCPKHNVFLKKTRVTYGEPDPRKDYSNVILGGCCIPPDAPKFGYVCPVNEAIYYLDFDGKLYTEDEEDLDPEYEI